MISKYVVGRVFVFIDAANIFYSQRTLEWSIDYKKLKTYFQSECLLKEIIFYSGKIKDNVSQENFLNKISSYGYIVVTKEIKIIRIGIGVYTKKGNLDTELVIDALKRIQEFDTCILMSGDSDFSSLVDELKEQGKKVLVMSTKKHISRELIERAKYIDLKKIREHIALQK